MVKTTFFLCSVFAMTGDLMPMILRSCKQVGLLLCALTWPLQAQNNQGAEELTFSHSELLYLEDKRELRYCVDPNWLPFEGLDKQGQHQGISQEYLQLFRQMLPVPITLVQTQNWQQSIAFVKERRCDFLPMAMKTPARTSFLNFSEVYLDIPTVLATTLDKAYVADLTDLPPLPVGVRRGFGFIELYQAKYPGLHLMQYDSYDEGLLAVQKGILYGFIGNMGGISYSLQQNKMNNLKIAGQLPGNSQMSLASRNDEPLLGSILQKLLLRVTATQQQQILSRWLSVRYEQGVNYQLVWQVLFAALALGSVWLWAYLKLRLLNKALHKANAELQQLSQRDPLTGLYNRQFFDQKLQDAIALCQRQQLTLTVAMMDLDHFKQLNDECGHLYGDACLSEFARMAQGYFQRPQDLLVRYGGEEFVLVSVGSARADMHKLLDAFVGLIASTEISAGEHHRSCTLSIGAYSDIPPLTLDSKTLLKRVDDALYQAKKQGRDQLVLIPALQPEP